VLTAGAQTRVGGSLLIRTGVPTMTASRRSSRDVAAEITDLIIRKLEEGVPPWSRPWRCSGAGGRPLRHCGTPYTGINTLYLWALGDAMGYRSRFWMTYRQAEALGANVRRGETGAISVYYSSFKKTEEHPETGKEVEKNIRFLRHYVVFNADQIDALPAYFYAPEEAEIRWNPPRAGGDRRLLRRDPRRRPPWRQPGLLHADL
jgi:antirestriction protein ArdC